MRDDICSEFEIDQVTIPATPHLLVSVFLSPIGLNTYRLGYCKDSDPFFRLSRFLTALRSLSSVSWTSATVFATLDEDWQPQAEFVFQQIRKFLPHASIHEERLLDPRDWESCSANYKDDDVILLTTNDDHAFVCQDHYAFMKLVQFMAARKEFGLGAVTHHAEMQALGIDGTGARSERHGMRSILVSHAIGTTLVRGDCFKSWWPESGFPRGTRVARPDNPIGPSVCVPETRLLIPPLEIMRHMDGYSHVALFRPVPPLRNTVRFMNSGHSDHEDNWVIRKWPHPLLAYRGFGCDIHASPGLDSKTDLRQVVAALQASWGLKFSAAPIHYLRESVHVRRLVLYPAIAIAALSPSLIRNVPDRITENLWKRVNRFVNTVLGRSISLPWSIWYLGLSRALLTRKRRSNMR